MGGRGNIIKAVIILLVLAGAAGFGLKSWLEQSARQFAGDGVYAVLYIHTTAEYAKRAGLPADSPELAHAVDALHRALLGLTPLGPVKSYGLTTVNLHPRTDDAAGLQPGADFHRDVQLEKGVVRASGQLRWLGDHWVFDSLTLEPQGDAQKIVQEYMSRQMLAGNSTNQEALATETLPGDEGEAATAGLKKQMSDLGRTGNLQRLDMMFANAIAHDEHLKDGRSTVRALGEALDDWFDDRQWDSTYAALAQWRKQDPQSGTAALVEASYWIAYAWDARGGGFANSVTTAGNRFYQDRITKAEQILLESKPIAAGNPLWYRAAMQVAMAKGSPETAHQLFAEGQRRFPDSDELYYAELRLLQPRWYGSLALQDAFIAKVTEATRARHGQEFYTQLYAHLDHGEDREFELFRQTAASWPLMRQGFDELLQRFPASLLLLNRYAAYACQAHDVDTFRALRRKINGNVFAEAWKNHYSYDFCSTTLGTEMSTSSWSRHL